MRMTQQALGHHRIHLLQVAMPMCAESQLKRHHDLRTPTFGAPIALIAGRACRLHQISASAMNPELVCTILARPHLHTRCNPVHIAAGKHPVLLIQQQGYAGF